MSIFVQATVAPKPRTHASAQVSLLFAALLVVMAATQLFTFEEFLVHIQAVSIAMGLGDTYILAPIIIVFEVFALPFLLRMWLSPAFRYFSILCGWLAASFWLFMSLWLVVSREQVDTVGFLGTLVDLTPGWWAVFISFSLVILALWSSWGLGLDKRSKG